MTRPATTAKLRAVDLFCGAGGSSRGAAMAGATPVAALDMWELATKTYQLNFPDAVAYAMKASELSPHCLLKDIGRFELLLASPECTNHSIARGRKLRCDLSRNTAFEVIRFAKVLRPRWVVVENVLQM
jgi:DNA (cytosine-5)-methyltransferase 1